MVSHKTLVVDNGSGEIKIGVAGEAQPAVKYQTVVGVPRPGQAAVGLDSKKQYIGDEAIKLKDMLDISYPIQGGLIKDCAMMEHVWDYGFHNELRLDPSDYNLLVTDSFDNPKFHREKMVEVMFERFRV